MTVTASKGLFIGVFFFFSSLIFFNFYSGRLSSVRHGSRKSCATNFPSACSVFLYPVVWLPVLGSFDAHTYVDAHGGCTDIVRKVTLILRKIPCCTGDSSWRQYCAWLLAFWSDALSAELSPAFRGQGRGGPGGGGWGGGALWFCCCCCCLYFLVISVATWRSRYTPILVCNRVNSKAYGAKRFSSPSWPWKWISFQIQTATLSLARGDSVPWKQTERLQAGTSTCSLLFSPRSVSHFLASS